LKFGSDCLEEVLRARQRALDLLRFHLTHCLKTHCDQRAFSLA